VHVLGVDDEVELSALAIRWKVRDLFA